MAGKDGGAPFVTARDANFGALDTIHENSSMDPPEHKKPRRPWKQLLLVDVWQDVVSRIPLPPLPHVGGGFRESERNNNNIDGDTSPRHEEEPRRKSSIQSGIRESLQTSVDFVTSSTSKHSNTVHTSTNSFRRRRRNKNNL